MTKNKLKIINPLVSVGFPIRNGEKTLERAINSILCQTEKNFELIISDNNSNQKTKKLLIKIKNKDSRIKYYRQDKTLTIFKNFDFVLKKSTGKYFLWIAHDDSRDPDYIKNLVSSLAHDANSILAFGDLKYLNDKGSQKIKFDFQTEKNNILNRIIKTTFIQCFHIYGVWKTEYVKKLSFNGTSWWGDLPFMMGACCLGTFKYVPGTNFYYLDYKKLSKERIYNQDLKENYNIILIILSLIISGYKSVKKVGGVTLGLISATLIFLKVLVLIFSSLKRQFKNIFTLKLLND